MYAFQCSLLHMLIWSFKDCEFSKLMAAVQGLKSRWAAVATPMPPAAALPPQLPPQQAAIRPTAHSTPMTSEMTPSTPTQKLGSRASGDGCLMAITPQKNTSIHHNTTPRSASNKRAHPGFSTPRTPNSSLVSNELLLPLGLVHIFDQLKLF